MTNKIKLTLFLALALALLGLVLFCTDYYEPNIPAISERGRSERVRSMSSRQFNAQVELARKGDSSALDVVFESFRYPPEGGRPYLLYITLANDLKHRDLKRLVIEGLAPEYNCTTLLFRQRLREVEPPEFFTNYPPETRECSPEVAVEFDGYLSKFTF